MRNTREEHVLQLVDAIYDASPERTRCEVFLELLAETVRATATHLIVQTHGGQAGPYAGVRCDMAEYRRYAEHYADRNPYFLRAPPDALGSAPAARLPLARPRFTDRGR